MIRSELAAYENKLQTMIGIVESLKDNFNKLSMNQKMISQSIGGISSLLTSYHQVMNTHHYSVLQTDPELDQTNAISMNVLNVSAGAWDEWKIASSFVPWYGGQGVCDLFDSLTVRLKGLQELFERRASIYVILLCIHDM